MNGPAYALVLLILLAPAAAAVASEETPAPQDEDSCDFFSWTLDPPDYRIDEDCPPLGSLQP